MKKGRPTSQIYANRRVYKNTNININSLNKITHSILNILPKRLLLRTFANEQTSHIPMSTL